MHEYVDHSIAEDLQTELNSRSNQLAQVLFESDREYFRAASHIEEFESWKIVRTPGFPDLLASCVLEAPLGAIHPPNAVLARLKESGVSTVRFYQPGKVNSSHSRSSSLNTTQELAYILDTASLPLPSLNPAFLIRQIQAHDDEVKVKLYNSRHGSPDGKPSNPREFVALERLKINAGYMQGYIVEHSGTPVACFGLSVTNQMVRLKNLLSSGHMRGKGCGDTIVNFATHVALSKNVRFVGVFAINNSAGQRLYERSNMRLVGVQTEYCSPIRHFVSGT